MAIIRLHAGNIDLWVTVKSVAAHLLLIFPLIPNSVDNLNTPSWALAIFFMAYLLIKPIILAANQIKSVKTAFIVISILFLLSLIWAGVFKLDGAQQWFVFHTNVVLRIGEFAIGIILARIFRLIPIESFNWVKRHSILVDILFIVASFTLFKLSKIEHQAEPALRFIIYHTIQPMLFTVLIALMAFGHGIIARFMALRPIRELGRGSFYPYLLHIPVASIINMIYVKITGDHRMFHHVITIVLLTTGLFVLGVIMNRYKLGRVKSLSKSQSTN